MKRAQVDSQVEQQVVKLVFPGVPIEHFNYWRASKLDYFISRGVYVFEMDSVVIDYEKTLKDSYQRFRSTLIQEDFMNKLLDWPKLSNYLIPIFHDSNKYGTHSTLLRIEKIDLVTYRSYHYNSLFEKSQYTIKEQQGKYRGYLEIPIPYTLQANRQIVRINRYIQQFVGCENVRIPKLRERNEPSLQKTEENTCGLMLMLYIDRLVNNMKESPFDALGPDDDQDKYIKPEVNAEKIRYKKLMISEGIKLDPDIPARVRKDKDDVARVVPLKKKK